MYERILVPTDGSDVAVTGAQAAFALADRFDATVHAIHVLESETVDVTYGETVVSAVGDAARDVDVETKTAVIENDGPVHRHIIEYAIDHDIDCIVMGTHGRDSLGQQVLGSVAERTLREAPLPVLTVHEETVVTKRIDAILIPTDGSDSANAAAHHGLEFAQATGASVHAVYVVDVTEITPDEHETVYDALEVTGKRAIDDVIQRARDMGISDIEASVLSGVPHQAIQDYAEASDVDYIVMGTHGRTGVSRYVLGSVTERVVRFTNVPVVSLKATEPDN